MAFKIFFGILLALFLIPTAYSLGGDNDGVGIAGVHGIGVFPEAASTTALAPSLAISTDKAAAVSTTTSAGLTMVSPPCKYPLVTLSPLTAEDFSLVSVPVTECLQTALDTSTLPLTCSEPSTTISWVTEGVPAPSGVVVVGCFLPGTISSAAGPPPIVTRAATSVTVPCKQPDIHTSPVTLADGSVTAVEVAVCNYPAKASATGKPAVSASSSVRKTTVTATTTTTVPSPAPTTASPRGTCKLLGMLHSWLTLDNSSVVVTRITTCLNFVTAAAAAPTATATTAAASPDGGLDENAQLVAELHAGHAATAGGTPSGYGALPSALTSFLAPPTETTLVVDTSSPPPPYPQSGTMSPGGGGSGSGTGAAAGSSAVGSSAGLSVGSAGLSVGSPSAAEAGTSSGASAPAPTSIETVSAARTTLHGGVSATPTTPAAPAATSSSGTAGLVYGGCPTTKDCCLAALCLVAGAYLFLG